jgi:hypothetical protein
MDMKLKTINLSRPRSAVRSRYADIKRAILFLYSLSLPSLLLFLLHILLFLFFSLTVFIVTTAKELEMSLTTLDNFDCCNGRYWTMNTDKLVRIFQPIRSTTITCFTGQYYSSGG